MQEQGRKWAGSAGRHWGDRLKVVRQPAGGEESASLHPSFSVHVVTSENRRLYGQELEASFRLRHQVYVNERNWQAFRRPDGRQVDCYDNGEAIYLLGIEDQSESLVCCARLFPTMHAAPLREFDRLSSDHRLPRSPEVFHISRVTVVPGRRGPCYFSLPIATIYSAVQEYGLSENIEQLTALVRMSLLPAFLELGWNPQPLGLPLPLWNTSCVVVTLDVSEVALERTRALRGIKGSVLVRRGITRPAVSLKPPARAS